MGLHMTGSTVTQLNNAFATRRLGLAAAPATLSSVAQGTIPLPVDVFGGYVWGYSAGNIYRSADDGTTWTTYCPSPAGDVPLRIIPCNDGEVIVARGTVIQKSSGWAGGSPTWTTKVTANGLARYQAFQVDGNGTKFIAAQYGPGTGGSQAWIDSRYAHISVDGGNTWIQVWDSVANFGATEANASHIHGACYDPWSDRFYLAEGHGATALLIAGVYVSSDNGATWTRPAGLVNQPPPTVMVATDDGIACGSDHTLAGGWGIVRQKDFNDETLVRTWAWNAGQDGVIGFGTRGFRDPDTGVVYIGYYTEKSTVAPIISGGTAAAAGLAWTWPTLPVAQSDQFTNLVVSHGRLLSSILVGGSRYSIRGMLAGPVGGAPVDTGNTRGGTGGGTAMAAGAGAVASGLRSTASGVLASATGTQDGLASGYNARATKTNTTAVGSGTLADGSNSTVVGALSSDGSFGNVVVLGSGKTATAAAQLQLGAMHQELTEVTQPAAPAADRVRLLAKDNGSGLTQLIALFNTGGAKVLATEGTSSAVVDPVKAEAKSNLNGLVVWDTFNRSSASGLGTADSGQTWTAPDMQCIGSVAKGLASLATGITSYIDAGVGHGAVACRIRRGPSRSVGLAFRVSAGDNGLMVVANSGGTALTLYSRVAGTNTQLATTTFDWIDTRAYDMRVIYRADRVRVFMDGDLTLSFTLASGDFTTYPVTLTNVGIFAPAGDTSSSYDNFVVDSLV